MAITKEELQSMRTAGYRIEPPAGDVINNLADEIDRLCARSTELETIYEVQTEVIVELKKHIKELERYVKILTTKVER
jgi:hypothetical protein